MKRFTIALILALFPTLALADDLTGTWNVTARPAGMSTCKNTKADVSAYQWILAQNGEEVSVSVQGETSFPKLTGKVGGGKVILQGKNKGLGVSNALWRLAVNKDGTLTGERLLASNSDGTICFIAYEVTAKKQ